MAVGFGFSVGDFISTIELVGTIIDALRESGDSSTEYQALISQLYTLETALLRVKRLELDDAQHAEVVALQQAASQCQRAIDAFWEKIKKYQPSLRAGGSGGRIKDGWRKVRWALCKKEDLMRFKADLIAHTESINILLTTVHMGVTRIDSKKNKDNHRTLAGKVQDSYFGCMQRMTVILESVSTGIWQGKQLIEMMAKVIQTNVQIFQMILSMHNIITQIPGQIERQQPVNFIDALGRHTPFFLEFVKSPESLTYVLQNNFKNIGSGAAKIERGEFAIQDTASKKDVNLALEWETCFYPGQHVAMSMVFNSAKASNMHCPKCSEDNGGDFAEDEDIECRKCHMVYRNFISLTSPQPLPSMKTAQALLSIDQSLPLFDTNSLKQKGVVDEDAEMTLFRRVRIKTPITLLAEDSRPGSPASDFSAQSKSVTEPCVVCNSLTKITFTCVKCNNDAFCDDCWSKARPHRPGAVGIDGLPHEKTNRQVVERLKQQFQPHLTAPPQPTSYAPPQQLDAAASQQNGQTNLVAQEVNGIVYYYDASQRPPEVNISFAASRRTPSPDGFYYPQPVAEGEYMQVEG